MNSKVGEYQTSKESGLLALPAEIILATAEFLELESLWYLHLSSRRLRYILKEWLWDLASASQSVTARKLIKRRQFWRKCIAERKRDRTTVKSVLLWPFRKAHREDTYKYLCSACLQVHDKLLFYPKELKTDPEKRVCAGAERTLPVCTHHTLTFKQVKARECRLVCRNGSKVVGHVTIPARTLSGQFTITSIHEVLKVDAGGLPDQETLASALKALNEPICPHLDSRDKVVVNILNGEEFRQGCRSSSSVRCTCWACNATAYMFRQRNDEDQGLDVIQLDIHRSLGQLSIPSEPGWMVAVLKPSSRRWRPLVPPEVWARIAARAAARSG